MAKEKTLLEISFVTDCDTGDYEIGETDFSIHVDALEKYLKAYGYKGKNAILATLGHLAYQVETRFREIPVADVAVMDKK